MAEEGPERAQADLEMLLAAFPDEITLLEESSSSLSYPKFMLSLSSSDSTPSYWANITMELPANGYPEKACLQVISYRGSSACPKYIIEKTVNSIRETATECNVNGEEAAIPCCLAATNTWAEAIEAEMEKEQSIEADTEQKRLEELALQQQEDGEGIDWITGETLTDRKR